MNANVEEYIDFLKLTLRVLEKVMLLCKNIESVYSIDIKSYYIGLSLSPEEEQEYTVFVDTDDIDPSNEEGLEYHMKEILDFFMFKRNYTSYSSVSYEFIKFIHLNKLNENDIFKLNTSSGYAVTRRDHSSILRYKTDKFFYDIQYPSKQMNIGGKDYLIFKL